MSAKKTLEAQCETWLKQQSDITTYVKQYIQDTTKIQVIVPNNRSQKSTDAHRNNTIFIVTAYKHSILLPGDADGTLFRAHLTQNFVKQLKQVEIFIAPHHGSIKNGEIIWLDAIFGHPADQQNKITFISCSQNDTQDKGSQYNDNQYFFTRAKALSNVFFTANAKAACYKLIIESDQSIKVSDGEKPLYPANFQ